MIESTIRAAAAGAPGRTKGLTHGDGGEHAAIHIHGRGCSDADGKDQDNGRADRRHGNGKGGDDVAVGDAETEQRAEQHRQGRSQHATPVARPERRPHAAARRHVPRIVGHVGRIGDLPQRADRHHSEKSIQGQAASLPEVGGQAGNRNDPHEASQECGTADPAHPPRIGMNQIVAVDRGGEAQERNQNDPGLIAESARDAVQGLAAEDQIGRDEAQVHEHHERDHEDGADGAELPTALHHLRYAELRPLRGVQCHENAADQISDQDGEAGRAQGQLKPYGRERTGHDGEDHDVGAEPNREQISRAAVTLVRGNGIDRVLLDAHGFAHVHSMSMPAARS